MAKVKKDYNSIYTPKTPSWVKRFAAWVVDIILVIVIASGVAFFTSAIIGYDKTYNSFYEKQIQYGIYVEDVKGDDLTFEGKNYSLYSKIEGVSEEEVNQRISALQSDVEFKEIIHKKNVQPIIITSVALFTSLLIFEFIIPLCLKHDMSIGRKFFSIGYVTDEDIDIGFKQIFVKFVFGKLLLNTFIPYLCILYILYNTGYGTIGLIVLILILGSNLFMLFGSVDKRDLPDYIARIKPCDHTCQIYFKTVEELTKEKCKNANDTKNYR